MSNKPKYEKQFLDRGTHFAFRMQDVTTPPMDHLPAGIYEIEVEANPLTGVTVNWNKIGPNFKVPEKRFGNHNKHMERIKDDYDRLNPAMGVLLTGLKGSGKSMFGEDLGNWIVGAGLPVLMINQPLSPEMLRHIIASTGPCMVYFDEFGKIYKEEERNKLLSLFSDTTLTGVLFVITGNDRKEFPDMVYDRPGRFRYRLSFSDLKTSAAIEVGEYYKLSELQTAGLARYVNTHAISWDMLCSVATMIRPCKSDAEIYEYLEIMNVPRWGRVEPEVLSIEKGGKAFYVKPETVSWDGTTLRARGCGRGDIDNLIDIEIPLQETVEYYKNHESGGDAGHTLTVGEFVITYKFKVINNFTPKMGATFAGNWKFDGHVNEVLAARKKAEQGTAVTAGDEEEENEGDE
ncbi:AAA family ATPase [Stenotrophomonas sp. GD03657]|uniref:AAA family ATPase n=1 Tax=Stenotrophomonas sp. GD03657 TaxID=2975363 RepID=UPI0024488664|nr:AAA family ATPase [Stenotrophomonas sp. GD03657]MDH2154138.1 ATP-binding protein [Stenotrophomonas sp. GD03657]